MKLVYTPQAREDLRGIKNYISDSIFSPQAANNVVRKIIKSCSNLKEFPNLGAELNKKFDVQTDMRYIVSSKYIVFYRVDEEMVKVIRIIDARTNYMQYLFE